MTSTYKLAVGLGMIISFLSLSVYAQSAGPELNRFTADGISFDYPAGYSVTDKSTDAGQQLIVTRPGSSVQLTIVVMRRFMLRKELPAAIESLKEPLINDVTIKLGPDKNPPERASIETQVGPNAAEGVRLRSSGSNKSTGEVIWLRMNFRLIGLTFVRADVDESVGSQLWQTVRSSLRVESPVVMGTTTTGVEPTGNEKIEGGVLNGKALELPQPAYPAIARAAHASGTVSVQVLINEQGNVIAARAVDGHPLLQAVSVAAAREAKFSPTLLEGEPVKVTGIIQYNFVLR